MYLLAIVSIFILKVNDVYAAQKVKISFDYQSNVYYTRKGDGLNDSHQYLYYNLNGIPAFCIEPGVEINDWDYLVYGIEKSPFNAEKTHRMQLIGYYGYEYPGHQTDRYYIAAQELIWKAVRPDIEVSWTTGINKSGDVIDISSEKNEIETLVRSHSLVPSFALNDVSGYLGEEIILNDENNVLDYYDISGSKYHEITKEGNSLKIKLNSEKVDDEDIILTRKHYDSMPLIVYYRRNSQSLAALRISNDKEVSFKITNKEKPIIEQVIEVPDTGLGFNIIGTVCMIVSGIGMIIGAIKIS